MLGMLKLGLAALQAAADGLRLLRDDRDLAGGLEHRPLDVVERCQLREARFLSELVLGNTRTPKVRVEHAAVLDQHERLPLEDRADAPRAEGHEAEHDLD